MRDVIPYASPNTPRLERPGLGTIAAIVGVSSAALIVCAAVGIGLERAEETGGWCGTARIALLDHFRMIPALWCIPAGALAAACEATYAVAICRMALWVAVAGWVVCGVCG